MSSVGSKAVTYNEHTLATLQLSRSTTSGTSTHHNYFSVSVCMMVFIPCCEVLIHFISCFDNITIVSGVGTIVAIAALVTTLLAQN